MTTIVVEGVGPVTLPDNMTREEMEAAIALLPKPETQRIRQFAQGATLNTSDEAEAYSRAALFGTKPEDELKQIRSKISAYQKAYPVESVSYELAGALTPSVALAPFTGGTSLTTAPVQAGPALGRLMALGAAQGGISGFASGESTMADRLQRSVGGTIAGGLAAPVAQQAVKIVGNAVTGLIDSVRRRVGDRGAKVVETELQRLVEDTGLLNADKSNYNEAVETIIQKIARGEIMAENATLQDAVRVYARGGGQASAILKKALTERPPALRGQAMNDLQAGLAGDLDANVLKSFRAGEKELGAIEQKLYTEAYAKGGVITPAMLSAADDALKRAPDSAKLINEAYQAATGKKPFFRVMDDQSIKWDRMPTLEDMEIIRRGTDSAKNAAFTSGSSSVGKSLGQAELALRAEIDNASLALKNARANVAANRSASEAFDAGRKVFTKSADEIQYDFENLVAKSEGATKAFRAGVMDALRNKASTGSGKTMMQKIEDPMSKEGQILRSIFPQDELDRMLATVGRASQSQRAATAVLGGSPTAPTQLNAARVGMNISAEEVSNAASGNPIAIFNVTKKALAKATPTLSDAQRAQIAQILVSEDPKFVLNALKDQSGIKMLQDRVTQMFGQAQRIAPSATAITAGSLGGDVTGGLLGR